MTPPTPLPAPVGEPTPCFVCGLLVPLGAPHINAATDCVPALHATVQAQDAQVAALRAALTSVFAVLDGRIPNVVEMQQRMESARAALQAATPREDDRQTTVNDRE